MNMKMWKDMLTERDGKERSYSQGRVYLLWSVLAYYITIGFMTVKSLRPDMGIEVVTLQTIIDALQWSMGLFAGYAFGGKGLEVLKTVLSSKLPGSNQAAAPAAVTTAAPAVAPEERPAP